MRLTEISVSRTIPAPAEKVFDVWIDPKSPGGPWFGAAVGSHSGLGMPFAGSESG
jgi:uncharacterized protein YndB with AHSA1/START domain